MCHQLTAVRWSASLTASLPPRGAYWRGTVARAVVTAVGDPGPVHLNLELSDSLVPAAEVRPVPPGRPNGAPWVSGSVPRRDQPAVRLDAGTPTVVIAGDGAGAMADKVAARAGWPVLAEPTSDVWGLPTTIPAAPAVLTDRGSGGSPMCQKLVPALSTVQVRPRCCSLCFKMPSASGERQILPRQTISPT